jgi:hypothetical protein
MLLLQHTHRRADQIVIPPRDYADLCTARAPSPLMIVLTAYAEPPGRGSGTEATVEYLGENRDMARIAALMESDASGTSWTGAPIPRRCASGTASAIGLLQEGHPRTEHSVLEVFPD